MKPYASKFLIYKEPVGGKQWANYTDENVLLLTHQVRPYEDLTDPVIDYVSTALPSLAGKRTPLQDLLMGSGRVRTVTTDTVRWKLRGTGEISAESIENLHPGVECPGIQGSEFQIKLNVEWYVPGDVLMPDLAKECQVVVQHSEPIPDGVGFIYNVQIVDRDPNSFFPPELLEPGLKWLKLDSVYSEASRGYGSFMTSGDSYIEFESSLTDYGKTMEVTNKAHTLNLKLVPCDAKDKPMKNYPTQLISYLEAEFIAQAKWEKELRLFYGRSAGNQIVDSTVGYHRRIGPGLLEFLEDGNVISYPLEGGSIEMFVDYLNAIWFDRVPFSERNVVVYTGQGGLTLWESWIAEKYATSPVAPKYDDFVGSAKSFDSKNYKGLKFKTAYFTEYNIFPAGSITVAHWPILDSTWLNGSLTHPRTGLPITSYHFIVLDYGLGNGGGNNIELIKRKDSEVYTYHCGVWSPVGALNNRNGKSGFTSAGPHRSYQLYHADTYGLRVKDITLTAWFKPCVQY